MPGFVAVMIFWCICTFFITEVFSLVSVSPVSRTGTLVLGFYIGVFFVSRELLVITPKGDLFISQTDLVKYLQIPVNASNPKKFPFFIPKVHPRVFLSLSLSFSCSTLQLRTPGSIWLIWLIQLAESIALINTKTIDTIDAIDTIYWHCRPHQPNCTTVVWFFDLPDWLRWGVLLCYIQCYLVGNIIFDSYYDYVLHSILKWYPQER